MLNLSEENYSPDSKTPDPNRLAEVLSHVLDDTPPEYISQPVLDVMAKTLGQLKL